MRKVVPAVVVLLAAAFLAGADLRHYSWLVYAQTLLYTLLWAGGNASLVAGTVLLQQCGVAAAVFGMSALECTLLHEAADEYGLAYIPLNFALHLAPVLLVLATWGGRVTQPRQQAATAGCVWLAYVLAHPHLSNYGCPLDATTTTATTVGLIVGIWVIAQWYRSAPHHGKNTPVPRPRPVLPILAYL